MGLNLFGSSKKSVSSSDVITTTTTTNTSTNQQAATESGIAVGAHASVGDVTVMHADPATAQFAIAGNTALAKESLGAMAYVTGEGQMTARHAIDNSAFVTREALSSNEAVSKAAISGIQGMGEMQLLTGAAMAGKFADSLSDSHAQNIGLLTSIASENANTLQKNVELTDKALTASFAQSRAAAPVSEGYLAEQYLAKVSDLGKYAAVIAVAIIAVFFFSNGFRASR